ncbi:MAG: T9SS type A sorting domain-containing protein [FCB group bacterium]|nr:T9SS type A sorting domain-containing protein [FCB group bacterium]
MKYLFCFILFFASLIASLLNVPAEYPTIQAGINAAAGGDTVVVQPGIYTENINFMGKAITVGSLFVTTGDHSFITQTSIDGNQSGSVVIFSSGEDDYSVLTGVTITNGFAFNGGGINCTNNSNPSLNHLIITGNNAYYNGGAVYLSNSEPVFESVTIADNNASGHGGGVYCSSSSPSVYNSILWNNTPQAIYFYEHGGPNAVTVGYSDIQGGPGGVVINNNGSVNFGSGNTNLDEDPLFILPGSDYNLQLGSPCINSGDPLSPPDPDGTITDMGALYFEESFGCTDPMAVNYDPGATNDDGSCIFAPIAEDIDVVINEDGYFTLVLSAIDPDGDAVVYSIWSSPLHGTAGLTDSTLTYEPYPDFFGNDTLEYIATDTDLNSDTATVAITVLPVNDPPFFTQNVPDQYMDFNTSSSILLFANDLDGDTLYFFAESDNSNLAVNTVGNSLTITPAENWGSNVNVTVSVYDRNIEDPDYNPDVDGEALFDVDNFMVTINLVGDYVSVSFGAIDYANHTIDVVMDNQMDIAGFQFEMSNINDQSSALFTIDNAYEGRAADAGFVVEFEPATIDHNSIILGYAAQFMPPIAPGDGVLTRVSYDAAGWVGPNLCLENITMTVPDGNEANIFVGSCVTYEVGQGDLLQDGAWDVLDIVQLVGIILQQNQDITAYQNWASDLNEDGTVNVTDAVFLVNLVMGTPLSRNTTLTQAGSWLDGDQLIVQGDAPVSGVEFDLKGEFNIIEKINKPGILVSYSEDKIIGLSLSGEDLRGLPLVRLNGDHISVTGTAVDRSGNPVELTKGELSQPEQPVSFGLLDAYPNPFNPVTSINFGLAEASKVSLNIYDLQGKVVATLVDERFLAKGSHVIMWDAQNLPSGIYFVRLSAAQQQSTRKITLLK